MSNPGLTATIQAAESVTGLQIGHYLMVDLQASVRSSTRSADCG